VEKNFYQAFDFERIYPVKTEKNASKVDDKISHARDTLDTYKMQPRVLSEKF
jgi:hypothetical protein